MNYKTYFFAIFIVLRGFLLDSNADTIYLKNGRSIDGVVSKEDNEGVELEIRGGSIKFQRSEVDRVSYSSDAENYSLRNQWEGQKQKFESKLTGHQEEQEHEPREVGFSRDSQGIRLTALLEGKVEVSLVLDTGASFVVLRRSVAEKLGINLDNAQPDSRLIVADGRQVNAKRIILKSIKVEDVEAQNVEACIMLDDFQGPGFGDGLLGMSFLRNFSFKVDYKERKLTLEKL